MKIAFLCTLLMALIPVSVMADTINQDTVASLAPSGRLRVAINYGNPILVQKDASSGETRGVSPALARELAARLKVPADFIAFDTAGRVFDALKSGGWDVAFLALDPVRAAEIDFTAPYVIIEGAYAVPANSSIQTIEDVDRPDVRVAVAKGSAYDLFLTRALKQAQLFRASTGDESADIFLRDKLDVLAGIKAPLVEFTRAHSGYRVVPGRFMAIEQAMGTPKGRDTGGRYLRSFVEEMKASGFVAKALADSGQASATVAP